MQQSQRWLATILTVLAVASAAVVVGAPPAHAMQGEWMEEFSGAHHVVASRWPIGTTAGTSVWYTAWTDGRGLQGFGDDLHVAEMNVAGRAPVTTLAAAPRAQIHRTYPGVRPGITGSCQLDMYMALLTSAAAYAEVAVFSGATPSGTVLGSWGTQVWELRKWRRFSFTGGFPQAVEFTLRIRIRVNEPLLELPARLGTGVLIDRVRLVCTEFPR
jgi:hypothetical protein